MGIASNIQICNNALLRLGGNTIASFNDNTTSSSACQNFYESTRKALLRTFIWNFAKTRVAIAASSSAPAFEYTNQYPLPADFLRVVNIYQKQSAYKIEGTMLLSNDAAPLNLIYIKDVTDTTQFDDLFVEALTLLLAIRMGPRLNGVGFTPGTMAEELKEQLSMAKLVDSQDQTPDEMIINDYESRMFSGIGPFFDPMKQG